MKFRHLLLSITGEEVVSVDEETIESVVKFEHGVDPFASCTIASVCMSVFRYLHL